MKTSHAVTTAVALAAVPFVVLKAPDFVIKSTRAQTEDLAVSRPSASEQNKTFVPRVTSLTSTALISRFSHAADPLRETVLIGRTRVEDMVIQLELEPAKPMPTATGSPAKLIEHTVGKGELYHVKVTPIDPRSNKRIPYTSVIFQAANKDNGRDIKAELQPMWNHSGLHYASNNGLAGDGVYEFKVIVGVPTFARDRNYQDRWRQPVAAKFHFRLAGGKLTEGSAVGQ